MYNQVYNPPPVPPAKIIMSNLILEYCQVHKVTSEGSNTVTIQETL